MEYKEGAVDGTSLSRMLLPKVESCVPKKEGRDPRNWSDRIRLRPAGRLEDILPFSEGGGDPADVRDEFKDSRDGVNGGVGGTSASLRPFSRYDLI